jgi:hypothetical protein
MGVTVYGWELQNTGWVNINAGDAARRCRNIVGQNKD